LYPLFEAEYGEITDVTKIRRRVDVADYLQLQRRFAHVFKTPDQLERIRAIAEMNIRKFGLLDD
jgi:pyruvate ferredoxin oxidoreductase beta subunit